MRESLIEVKDLYKIYGEYDKKFEALKNININIKKGEFLGIMGTSGSGKSTLVNILSTLDTHSKGKVFIKDIKEDVDLRKLRNMELSDFRRENVGFIFQNYNLLSKFTNRENILFPLMLADVSDEEAEKRIEKLSKDLEIEGILDKYPNECSGGQKQRIAIARALSNNSKIIFADEPTDSLDAKIGINVLNILKKLNREKGITVVLVTHSEIMASFSDRVIVLEEGVIRKELINNHKKQFDFYNDIVEENSKKMELLLEN
ncbi:MAG: ABC transporter ATP-binding protein [Clostridium sp.]|uniref:ABC transporter ATP-binding protein n=1 Tax=Clostridium sp. TaxID=1506 RepID=UPI003EE8128C